MEAQLLGKQKISKNLPVQKLGGSFDLDADPVGAMASVNYYYNMETTTNIIFY